MRQHLANRFVIDSRYHAADILENQIQRLCFISPVTCLTGWTLECSAPFSV
jgi:hypothetical protein